VDEFNIASDTGEIKISLYISQLSNNQETVENVRLCKAENEQV
jgi:hypothetical protein